MVRRAHHPATRENVFASRLIRGTGNAGSRFVSRICAGQLLNCSDILVPEPGMRCDEFAHQLNARRVVQHFHFYTLRTQVFLRAFERDIFADDNARDFVKQRGAAAHRTGRQRRVKRATGINRGLEPARILQTIHFRVVDDTPLLDTLIVAASDDFPVTYQNRPDGDAALSQTFSGFLDGGLKERIHTFNGEINL